MQRRQILRVGTRGREETAAPVKKMPNRPNGEGLRLEEPREEVDWITWARMERFSPERSNGQ